MMQDFCGVILVVSALISAIHSFTFPDDVELPAGFTIEKWLDPGDASSINGYDALGNSGITFENPRTFHVEIYNGSTIIYVGSQSWTNEYVYAIIDYDNDASPDQIFAIFESDTGRGPGYLAIDPINHYIYVNAVKKTYICECNVHETVLSFDTSRTDERLPNCREWIETPTYTWHGSNYLEFNPEPRTNPYNGETYHELCVNYGAACNRCDNDYPQQTIICFPNLESDLTTNQNSRIYEFNSTEVSIDNYEKYGFQVAAGTRSVVGLSFHPLTNDLWFTDNGRDKLGNNFPDDKLNVIKSWNVNADGNSDEYPIHFGFPYCHCEGTGDPYQRDIHSSLFVIDNTYNAGGTCNQSMYQVCTQPLGPHVAALGMAFYNLEYTFGSDIGDIIPATSQFPDDYYNSIFIAQHGSWNRDDKIGYRVVNIKLGCENSDYSTVIDHELFINGWVNVEEGESYARPADVALLPDGSLLVSEDKTDSVIYRVTYDVNNDGTRSSLSDSTVDYNETELCYCSDYMNNVRTVTNTTTNIQRTEISCENVTIEYDGTTDNGGESGGGGSDGSVACVGWSVMIVCGVFVMLQVMWLV